MSGLKQSIDALLEASPALGTLLTQLRQPGMKAWLVGGAIRDLLLQRSVVDLDVATVGDPTPLAKIWAAKSSGRWFWLDADRQQSRVLLPDGLTVDFAPLRAASIEEDLLRRDFTINALAYPLHANQAGAAVLDPYDGERDINNRMLVLPAKQSFHDDPLRMLKGIRHAAVLNLQLSAGCFEQMQLKAALIKNVAGERIRDEFGKILASERAVEGIRMMLRTGLIETLWGPEKPSWQESRALAELKRLRANIKELQVRTEESMNEEGREEILPQKAIFLLAKWIELYAPMNLPNLLHKRLRMSRHQQKLIQALQQHPGPQWLDRAATVSDSRQQALLVEQLDYAPLDQLVYLSLTEEQLPFERAVLLSHAYRKHQVCGRVPDLIEGQQLEYLLRGRPKHEIGIWQNHIKSAEIAGEIASTREATTWLNQQLCV